jgi:hypothetical protein
MSLFLQNLKEAYQQYQTDNNQKIIETLANVRSVIMQAAKRGEKDIKLIHSDDIDLDIVIKHLRDLGLQVKEESLSIIVSGWTEEQQQQSSNLTKQDGFYIAPLGENNCVDYLKSAVTYFKNCSESSLKEYSIPELLNIYAAYRNCAWDYTTHQWTFNQREKAAATAKSPVFDMDGLSVED